ncbi:MAG: glycosyltransferase family 4 protein [Chloroflexi bacterium]|nr:glycosyltransferase family 4 protein [Chloroflexota bacterium]
MRSLLMALEFPPQIGGIQTIMYEICTHLPRGEIEVLAPQTPGDESFDAMCDLTVHRKNLHQGSPLTYLIDTGLGKLVSPLMSQFRRYILATTPLLAQNPFDLIQCSHFSIAPAACVLSRRYGIPYVIYTYAQEIMSPHVPRSRPGTGLIGKWAMQHAHAVFTISEFTRTQVLKWGVSPDKIVQIPLGPTQTTQVSRTEVGLLQKQLALAGKRVILTVGRLVERKGQDMVLRAMPQILARVPNTVYLIAGTGPMEQLLRRIAADQGVSDHVIFLGDIPHERIGPYYAVTDVFLMPSRAILRRGDVEGFGLVYLEANAFAKPCIGGREGGVPDAVLNGETGLLVNPWSPDDIAQATIHLLEDRALAERLGRTGQSRVQQEMNWSNTAQVVRRTLTHALQEENV